MYMIYKVKEIKLQNNIYNTMFLIVKKIKTTWNKYLYMQWKAVGVYQVIAFMYVREMGSWWLTLYTSGVFGILEIFTISVCYFCFRKGKRGGKNRKEVDIAGSGRNTPGANAHGWEGAGGFWGWFCGGGRRQRMSFVLKWGHFGGE